ncbi:MAG: epoxyqueuosine reductase QueH [Candidatus Omnitrophota bacterium]|nr:epoxyqueuosine reductase QueH [Candidatus Omnitrophota bacterium]MBU1894757.1 epoxyqueuosine reductase QueH [Candidatus Omnitrophota bacterium]
MKILLHTCCGVCAGAVIERLLCEGHSLTCFFYNPNIHPVDEYKRRLEAAQAVARQFNIEFVEGIYDRETWFLAVKGKEYEPEGGTRCRVCYELRLKKTYEYMKKKMFDAFTTTLSISPHKDAVVISSIGREISEDRFISADFKKKGGFSRAGELAKDFGLYRQNYCGCIYSLEKKLAKDKK